MLISSHGKPLEDIVRGMKSYTSSRMKALLKEHPQESRREWIVWIAGPDLSGMERAGKKNSNNSDWQFWQQHNQPIEIVNQKMYVETV